LRTIAEVTVTHKSDSSVPNGTFPELLSVDGGEGATKELYDAGSEANLDFQMAYGLIWPQEPALFQVDDEWYQQSQLRSAEYAGFFNSKSTGDYSASKGNLS
jgi:tripeptidyl-peptidase-1